MDGWEVSMVGTEKKKRKMSRNIDLKKVFDETRIH